jgi:hypothetical protein
MNIEHAGFRFVPLGHHLHPTFLRLREWIHRHGSKIFLFGQVLERCRIVAMIGIVLVDRIPKNEQVFFEGRLPRLCGRRLK